MSVATMSWTGMLSLFLAISACADRDKQSDTAVTLHETAGADSASAIERLMRAEGQVHWDAQSVVAEDIDCDGKVDSAFVGRSDSSMYVGVLTSAGTPPEVLEFGLNGNAVQNDVCSDKAKLTAASLDYDPKDAVGELPGFQRSRVCKGLNLGEEDCDSMHLFWNHESHHLDWWRA